MNDFFHRNDRKKNGNNNQSGCVFWLYIEEFANIVKKNKSNVYAHEKSQ